LHGLGEAQPVQDGTRALLRGGRVQFVQAFDWWTETGGGLWHERRNLATY
jgi:hypothetical protein